MYFWSKARESKVKVLLLLIIIVIIIISYVYRISLIQQSSNFLKEETERDKISLT